MGWFDSLFGRSNRGGEGPNAARSVPPHTSNAEGANLGGAINNAQVRADQTIAGGNLSDKEIVQNTGDNNLRSTATGTFNNTVNVISGGQANERKYPDQQSQLPYGRGPSGTSAPASNSEDILAAYLEIESLKWQLGQCDHQKEILIEEKRQFEEENRQLRQNLSAYKENNRRLKEMLERYQEQERLAKVHQILRSTSPSINDSTGLIYNYILQFKTRVNMDRNFNLPG